MRLGTEALFDLFFGGLETLHQSPCVLVGILFQPTEVGTDSVPDFGLFTNKPGGHAVCVFCGVDVSTNFDFDLAGK